MRRGGRIVAALVLTAVAATACGAPERLPEPRPGQQSETVPVVADVQAERVLFGVTAALAAGDEALDAGRLEGRVEGTALQARQATYTALRADDDVVDLQPVGGTLRALLAPRTGEWPRFFVIAVQPEDEAAAPQLLTVSQSEPRARYRLAAWTTLLPGASLPALAPEGEGPEVVAPDDATLAATPAEVTARYADVLTNSTASEFASGFASDGHRELVASLQRDERRAAGNLFSYTVAHEPREDALWSMRTADGGALVTAVIDSTRTFEVSEEGASLTVPDYLAALAGEDTAEQEVGVQAVSTVTFLVPAAGDDAPVRVLASSRADVAASVS